MFSGVSRTIASSRIRVYPVVVSVKIAASIRSSAFLWRKYELDYSKVPVLQNNDLEEQFVRGSGPGGQKVNKSNNCVVLIHKPTGLVVKCHQTRSRETNCRIAREIMVTKLDNLLNGADSIEEQKKQIDDVYRRKAEYKKEKLAELKKQWKDNFNET